MSFAKFVSGQRKKQIHNNINILINDISKQKLPRYLIIKLKNFINKYQLEDTIEDLKKEIINDKYLQCLFSKDILKQNFCENCQYEYIRNHDVNISKLPQTGPESLRIYNNKIIKHNIGCNSSKSIDFEDDYKNYIFAKYIERAGGAQDNQYREVLTTINQCRDMEDYFIFLVDGKYFTTKRKEYLKSMCGPNELICSSEEYIKYINNK